MGGSNKFCLPVREWRPGETGITKDVLCNLINKIKNILLERKLSPVASTYNYNQTIKQPLDAKADSGASKHFFKFEHIKYLKNVQRIYNGPFAHLPINTTVQATHKGYLNMHKDLSKQASEVLIFPI